MEVEMTEGAKKAILLYFEGWGVLLVRVAISIKKTLGIEVYLSDNLEGARSIAENQNVDFVVTSNQDFA